MSLTEENNDDDDNNNNKKEESDGLSRSDRASPKGRKPSSVGIGKKTRGLLVAFEDLLTPKSKAKRVKKTAKGTPKGP